MCVDKRMIPPIPACTYFIIYMFQVRQESWLKARGPLHTRPKEDNPLLYLSHKKMKISPAKMIEIGKQLNVFGDAVISDDEEDCDMEDGIVTKCVRLRQVL